MKILHICICGEFYEKYAYQENLLTKYHRIAGHDVTVLASTRSFFDQNTGKVIHDKTKTKLLENGIKIRRIDSIIPFVINKHIHYYGGFSKIVRNEKPDLIFVHGVASPNYLYLSRYKKNHPSVKIVYDNHADFVNSQHSIITKLWSKYIIRDVIVKKLIQTSNFFYGTTPVRSDFLRDFYLVPEDKISFLPMGADDEFLQLSSKEMIRAQVRAQYNITDEEFLIVTGGKIDRKKNIHTLVEAVNSINKPVKILVFGSIVEDMKQIFEKLESDKTIFIGWLPSNEVYRYFFAADLVVFPGLHSVLWEQAVASQVPTAFSKIKGFEHVNFNDNAILFEENTSDYYAAILDGLISDKQRYEILKKNASGKGAQSFLYSKIAQKVIDDNFKTEV